MLARSVGAVVFCVAAAAGMPAGQGNEVMFASLDNGKVVALALDAKGGRRGGAAVPQLKVQSEISLGGSQSFLALDKKRNRILSVDEGTKSADGNGSIITLGLQNDGTMVEMGRQTTPAGPVFLGPLGSQMDKIAMPHFGGKAITVSDVSDPNNQKQVQRLDFELEQPGPRPEQSEAKPHQTLLDPTGSFVVAPDLGADLVRMFRTGGDGQQPLQELDSVPVTPGSGPRHAVFVQQDDKTFMYVVTELSSELIGFEVSYTGGAGEQSGRNGAKSSAGAGMQLKQLFAMKVHGSNPKNTPEFAAASELVVSPDQRFVMVASRNESDLSVPSFDGSGSSVVSDSISNYRVGQGGALEPVQIRVACGGRFPRQFSVCNGGRSIAITNQLDGRVVLMERDVQSGKLGGFMGACALDGNVTAVVC